MGDRPAAGGGIAAQLGYRAIDSNGHAVFQCPAAVAPAGGQPGPRYCCETAPHAGAACCDNPAALYPLASIVSVGNTDAAARLRARDVTAAAPPAPAVAAAPALLAAGAGLAAAWGWPWA